MTEEVFDSVGWSWSSPSKGCDSCFAAACKTLLCTSDDEGDVDRPIPLLSNFPAAHEIA